MQANTKTNPAPAKLAPVAKPAKLAPVAVTKPSRTAAGPTYKTLEATKARSTLASPVAAMWALCNSTIGQPRKAVVLAAIAEGISYHTARTQYQAWLKAA